MTSSTIIPVNDNERMDPTHPRADGPRRRRVFTASEKLAHLQGYEQACEHGDGGAYLRREGLVFVVDLRVAQAARRRGAGRQEAR
ncbi:hypothetical protein MDOR_05720 [Mycolicibacterium doricum]|uniref:Uncharacterized protein n=1 Tax=Mycolicibacterium doricum TaxID=126673 RepID=A0A7I7VQH6_9MYCO|nr:hypothetical protein MDOR_05720 [Mycolicibacterium doricum]